MLTSIPAAERSQAVESDRLRELRALSQALADGLEALSGPAMALPVSTPAHALYSLLRGGGGANDEALLGVAVRQGRLVSVMPSADARRPRLLSALGDLQRVVVVAGPDADDLVVLVPDVPKRPGESRSRALAELVARRAAAADEGARVGVSSALPDATSLPAALEEARCASRLASGSLTYADDVWAGLSTERLSAHLARCLPIDNPIVRLRRHDQEHGTDFAGSVAAWLRADCDTTAAAERLTLHANTLRYRLKRAQELSGLDLRDPATRTVVYLALVAASPMRS